MPNSLLALPTEKNPLDARRRLLLGATLCAALLATGCKDTLRVGAVLPLSGEQQALGEDGRRGLELAADELRAAGIEGFELEIADSQSDPTRAAAELERLIEEGAVAAVGGSTNAEARSLARVADERERVLISPSSNDQLATASSKLVFRISHSDADAGSSFATLAKKMGLDTAELLAADEQYAETLREGFGPTFETLDGSLAETRIADVEALGSASAEISANGPSLVALSGGSAWVREAVRELRGAGYGGKIFAPQNFAHPATLESLGDMASGVLFAHGPFDPKQLSPEAQSFADAYRAKYGQEPSIFAAEAYDSLKVLVLAMKDRPALPGEVRRALRDEIKGYAGVTGSIEFDGNGAASKFPRVFGVDDRLAVYDYSDWMETERQRIEDEKEALRERLAAVRRQAAQGASH